MDLQKLLNPGLNPESIANLNPMLRDALQNMVRSAPADIQGGLRINSGYRSEERQRQLYEAALRKYGNEQEARRWVAPPGRSQHNFGKAVDIGFLSPRAKAWVHENAAQFGLHFPMSHEPWHIEMKGRRSVASPVGAVPVSSSGTSPVPDVSTPVETPVTARFAGLDDFDVMRSLTPRAVQGPTVVRGQLDPTIYQNI